MQRALLVAFQYEGDKALDGPSADLLAVHHWLVRERKWPASSVTVVSDRMLEMPPGTILLPPSALAQALAAASAWTQSVGGGDLFFFYAGHGTQRWAGWGEDEPDKHDEVIVLPPDGRKVLRDNVLRRLLVAPLHPDARLLAIFDACSSATLLDLPCLVSLDPCERWAVTRGGASAPTRAKVLCLSAAQDAGFAEEEGGRGLFTAALLRELQAAPRKRALASLLVAVQRALRRSGTPQRIAASSTRKVFRDATLDVGGFLLDAGSRPFAPPCAFDVRRLVWAVALLAILAWAFFPRQ
jgi:hypothetical protein